MQIYFSLLKVAGLRSRCLADLVVPASWFIGSCLFACVLTQGSSLKSLCKSTNAIHEGPDLGTIHLPKALLPLFTTLGELGFNIEF